MATVTIGPDAADIGGAWILFDALFTMKNATTAPAPTSTSAIVAYDIPETDTQLAAHYEVDFHGSGLNTESGVITSFDVYYGDTLEYSVSGLFWSSSALRSAILDSSGGNSDALRAFFLGMNWSQDFSASAISVYFTGTGGNDNVTLTSENDRFGIDGGNDNVELGAGDDVVVFDTVLDYHEAGTVKIDGGAGKDTLDFSFDFSGQGVFLDGVDIDLQNLKIGEITLELDGFEWVKGTPFDDVIKGTKGADYIDGVTGTDTFTGRGGADTLLGNDNSEDRYIYLKASDSKAGKSRDILGYFEPDLDKIDLSRLHPATKNDEFKFVGDHKLKNVGDLRVVEYETKDGADAMLVQANLDKDSKPEFEIVIIGNHDIDKTDFML